MSELKIKKLAWRPKEIRRPQEASDTEEDSESEYYRAAAPYEVRLQLGPIEYGQDHFYYDDNRAGLEELTYLQRKQAHTDTSMLRKDKKGRVIPEASKDKLLKRYEQRKARFDRKKKEKKLLREQAAATTLQEFESTAVADDADQFEGMGLPTHFGKAPVQPMNTEAEIHSALRRQPVEAPKLEPIVEVDMIGPALPTNDDNSDGTRNSDYEAEELEAEGLPTTHEALLEGHSKAVNDFDINPSHTQMATASMDHTVRLWDFTQMDELLVAYRSFTPIDSHPVLSCRYSLNGKHLLICAGGIQTKIFSKDGRKQFECVKGDMYMADMLNTKGHVKQVTEAAWHPSNPLLFLTSSLDGTCRVWDMHGRLVGLDKHLGHRTLHKARSERQTRIGVSCCVWAPNGHCIAAGGEDGSLQVWETERGHSAVPDLAVYNAHRGDKITCVKFFKDSQRLLSRGQDHTMKLWDLRQFSKPVTTWDDLPNFNFKTQLDLSPDEQFILTGTSAVKQGQKGMLHIYDSATSELVSQTAVSQKSVTAVRWVPDFNQIFVGGADGVGRLLYSPQSSKGGVIDCLKRKAKEEVCSDMPLERPVLTPYSLSQFKTHVTIKGRESDKVREDPVATRRPTEPLFRPGGDGRLIGQYTIAQYVLKSINEKRRPDDDPREMLLSYHPDVEGSTNWVKKAYQKTQPKPEYDYTLDKFEEREYLDKNPAPKCKSCGLKFCQCPRRRTTDDLVFPYNYEGSPKYDS
jgi:WD40 repeat protein